MGIVQSLFVLRDIHDLKINFKVAPLLRPPTGPLPRKSLATHNFFFKYDKHTMLGNILKGFWQRFYVLQLFIAIMKNKISHICSRIAT